MEETVIKNEKQVFFNQIRGEIFEICVEDKFSNVVLSLGHENVRHASFVTKTELFNTYKDTIKIGDKVMIRFYISSRKKHDRWYTTATILDVQKI
jgi:hypothetical protein